MDKPTEAFAAAVRAAANAAGANLSADATAALVKALDADESNWFLSRYVEEPPAALVESAVAKFLKASPPKPEDKAGEHAATYGVPAEVWQNMKAIDRLTIARKAGERGKVKAERKGFPERRLEADLHASRLRLSHLTGEERARQAARVATLEAQLKEARAAR